MFTLGTVTHLIEMTKSVGLSKSIALLPGHRPSVKFTLALYLQETNTQRQICNQAFLSHIDGR